MIARHHHQICVQPCGHFADPRQGRHLILIAMHKDDRSAHPVQGRFDRTPQKHVLDRAMNRWPVVQDRIFQVVVPTEDEIEIRDGQRRTVKKKLYPGYVLVQTIELKEGDPDSDEAWHMIRNTTGVTGFVSSGTRPVPLSQEEVNHILRAMRMEQPRVRVGFAKGQNIRIVDGPFEDFVGTVDEINTEKGRVKVVVNMFGRETPVELDFLQVEKL